MGNSMSVSLTVWELFPLSSMEKANAVFPSTPLPTAVNQSTKASSHFSMPTTDHGPLQKPSTAGKTTVAKLSNARLSPTIKTTLSCLSLLKHLTMKVVPSTPTPILDASSLTTRLTTSSGRRMPGRNAPSQLLQLKKPVVDEHS